MSSCLSLQPSMSIGSRAPDQMFYPQPPCSLSSGCPASQPDPAYSAYVLYVSHMQPLCNRIQPQCTRIQPLCSRIPSKMTSKSNPKIIKIYTSVKTSFLQPLQRQTLVFLVPDTTQSDPKSSKKHTSQQTPNKDPFC